MKKFLVLGILFMLPLVAYLFFASGVHNFAKLPILHEGVGGIENLKALDGKQRTFNDKITIVGFLGKDIDKVKGNAFNLNQKIYKKNHTFNDFQLIMISPYGTENETKELLKELGVITDMSNWTFLFGTESEIEGLFNSLSVPHTLDENLATPYVYIIDKKSNLRGRDDNAKKKEEKVYGYNSSSVADLNNVMVDDVKVILAEYRLELKKYKAERKNK